MSINSTNFNEELQSLPQCANLAEARAQARAEAILVLRRRQRQFPLRRKEVKGVKGVLQVCSVVQSIASMNLTANTSGPTSSITIPAGPPNAPSQPEKNVPSDASKAGIAVGVIIAVIIVCSILYLFYRRRRRARQTQPIGGDGAVDRLGSGTTELKDNDKSLDPPPAYPYEKIAPELDIEGIPGSGLDTSGSSRGLDLSQPLSTPSKYERPDLSQHGLDVITHHGRAEIDSSPLYKTPASHKRLEGLTTCETSVISASSQAQVDNGSGYVDPDHLSKLEQEEQQLQEEIAQIERLERLKVERDRVRQRIRDLSEQPRQDPLSLSTKD
ncbi:MAG: hypothetical protein Q9218_003147 [Villophora microphyllina]